MASNSPEYGVIIDDALSDPKTKLSTLKMLQKRGAKSLTALGDLKSALRKAEGKEVSLSVKINPDIIGGMVVKLGHRMIDASLKTKLNALRVAMREVR